ncbi:hypothetical protein [Flagellimonas olearia]|uniref:Uncharacterized protein n=1 Tax=Flagellimonas olearia TaxID=552546 RepID=A0A444VLT0_9FLAO|nr:hypothetical protein [Allomuricauda olearia]RYC51751.1 hypothetical protein DN53_13055 [Allomuricauda olearia]
MKVGERKKVGYRDFPINDNGVSVKKALKLIENSDHYEKLYDCFKISGIEDEFIPVTGANSLVNDVLAIDSKFTKFDVATKLKNVRCEKILDKKSAIIEISNIEDEDILKITESDLIAGTTKYSVKSEFLDLFSADKFLNYCHDNEYDDIIQTNLKSLDKKNSENDYQKQFRFLIDKDNNYFVRAITSVSRYKDYNIKFSVFVALISIHQIMKSQKEEYMVRYYTCSESDIRIVFTRMNYKKLMKGLEVGFELELVNDEIKRDAVKFNGLFSLNFGKEDNLIIKPNLNAKMASFSHQVGVDKVVGILQNLAEAINEFVNTIHKDAEYIKKAQSPQDLKNYLFDKVKKSKQKEFREKYRKQVQAFIQKENVNTIFQLLDLMNKVDLMIDDSDIKAKDFWRHKLYEILVESKKPNA